ncbi:LOW QUALITY PROTEIN: hypothetical protein U9M48_029368 [Paspalum notatum var. saurae]|uniref:Reverse transcriptase/retrotransposon-derived protein RNase H-like domain-containing protein n=1 Tax=Paspalum notatum var. saurae TaxID=547442 RepID=A0AAQ3X287_PASNO
MASYNLEEGAQMWYLRSERSEGTPSWRRFSELLNLGYGPPLRSNPPGELMACKRKSSVAEYRDRFEALLPRAGPPEEERRIRAFTAGLRPPLNHDVEMHNPRTPVVAMSLARKPEPRERAPSRPHRRRRHLASRVGEFGGPNPAVGFARTPPRGAPPPPPPGGRSGGCRERRWRTVAGRASVLTVMRNSTAAITESVKGSFFLIWRAEEDDDDTRATHNIEDPLISLHAITGVRTGETMRVRIRMGGASALAPPDSGSTHNFVSSEAASRAFLRLCRARRHEGHGGQWGAGAPFWLCRAAPFSIEGERFAADFFVPPLAGYDIVLGTQWLASAGPILWDFGAPTMSFGTGITASPPSSPSPPHASASLPGSQHPPSPGSAPVAVRPYRYPVAHKTEPERRCKRMLERGLIGPGSSAFSSPVLLVKKPDSSWRFCVDYRALNAITVKDAYPIPVVDEPPDELHGAQFFTKPDLRSGYHQVRMNPADIEKTAFRTHDALVRVHGHALRPLATRRQHFGHDERSVAAVLAPLRSRLLRRHFNLRQDLRRAHPDVRTVLTTLRRHQLFAKRSKCAFGASSIAYLGHVISVRGVAMDPEKVRPWRIGLVLARYVPFVGFGARGLLPQVREAFWRHRRTPQCTCSRRMGSVGREEATTAFGCSKTALTTAPVLALPDFGRSFTVECDASTYGFGAVLTQGHHPVAFSSGPAAPRHRSSAAYERELIGLVMAIRHRRPYLWGRRFLYLPDRRSATIPRITGLESCRDLILKLSTGRAALIPSPMRRLAGHRGASVHTISGPHFDFIDRLRIANTQDPALIALKEEISSGRRSGPWSLVDGMVAFEGRLYIPPGAPLAVRTASHRPR